MPSNDSFIMILKSSKRLPTLPGIALKIIQATQKEDPSLSELADIVSIDPALSLEVLKLINSSFYNLPRKIASVLHAVQMLGIHVVKNLALGFTLVKALSAKKGSHFDYSRFWRESLYCAVAAKLIACRVAPRLAEDAFFIGLLHNIGILAMMQAMPRQYQTVLRDLELGEGKVSDFALENKVLGFNHMQVGRFLSQSWGLPECLSEPIGCHHAPELRSDEDPDIRTFCEILHLSTLYIGYLVASDRQVPKGLIEFYQKRYLFEESFCVEEIGQEIEQQAEGLFPLFDLNRKPATEQRRIIQEARKQLAETSMELIAQVVEQKRLIEKLHERILRDSMTQLYNYHGFHEALQVEKQRSDRYGQPFSIILGDIDDFKKVNDGYGHLVGDAVIKQVSQLLRSKTRSSDFVARYGGEEFGIILPETPLKGALVIAERLRQAIAAKPFDIERSNIVVTMSFGITAAPIGARVSKEELIDKADQVLYEAKRKGKNKCCTFLWENA